MTSIALAVALAAPTAAIVFTTCVAPASAQQQTTAAPAAAAPATPSDQLQQGVKQYRDEQYEESVKTLKAISPDQLSASGQSMLKDTLAKADAAATQRKAARDEFDAGEKALAANDPATASQHYRLAANNRYADPGTKQKAAEQLALAQSMKPATGTATTPGAAQLAVTAAPAGGAPTGAATAGAPTATAAATAAPRRIRGAM